MLALIEESVYRGANVVFLCSKVDPYFEKHPLIAPRITIVKNSGWTRWRKIVSFEKAIKQWIDLHAPDIVFGIERTMHATHLRLGDGLHRDYLKNRSFFCKWHPYHRKILSFEKQIFETSKTSLFIANSEMVKHSVLQTFHKKPHLPIIAIHNGSEPKQIIKTKMESLLFVGGDFRRKGLFLLLKALKNLPKKIPLTVVGKDRLLSKAQKYAKKHQLNVRFTGQADPTPYYETSSHFILPTLYDPFANVTLEALMHGCFVITSPFNGACEILKQESGIVLETLSVKSIEDGLKKALAMKVDPKKIADSVQSLSLKKQIEQLLDHVFI